jgi:2-C-methyl-D-erythritol 4-phosphate cytidylyltransferase
LTVWGIVVAAGAGQRFGGAKHELELRGLPLWAWARRSLLAGGVGDVVVVGPVQGGVPGGERRQDSVAAGLAAVPETADFILVHDAARPLAGPDLVRRVAQRLLHGDADGVVPVVPVRDTLKRISEDVVTATLDRSLLRAAQTPQGFRAAALRDAHRRFQGEATDDAAMVEAIGGTVVTVMGDPGNIKLTYPEDLRLLEALAP